MLSEKNRKNKTIRLFLDILIAFVIALTIKTFVFNTTLVVGESMYPSLHDGDKLFVNKISTVFHGYKRGDIVILEAPDDIQKKYIKRIIGVSGDTVEIKNGKVYLNGRMLKENYIIKDLYTHTYNEDKWKVPIGHVFLLGDNREEGASKDSRLFDCVSLSSLRGKAVFRYFPFCDFSKLRKK